MHPPSGSLTWPGGQRGWMGTCWLLELLALSEAGGAGMLSLLLLPALSLLLTDCFESKEGSLLAITLIGAPNRIVLGITEINNATSNIDKSDLFSLNLKFKRASLLR
jgi:hypothetical protein